MAICASFNYAVCNCQYAKHMNGIKALKKSSMIVVAMAGCCGLSNVSADILPGSVMPEQVGKSLMRKPLLRPAGPAQPSIKELGKEKVFASPDELKLKFILNDIHFNGNHVYSYAELLPLFKDKLHHKVTVSDIYAIAESVTLFYRNNGYILSFAYLPPQRSKSGVIRINIIEGYISSATVIGQPSRASALIQKMILPVKESSPFNIGLLRNRMLLINQIPGVTARAIIGPAKSGQGAADLHIDANTSWMNGYVSFDTYGTRYIGPQQITAQMDLYSTLRSGDSVQATFAQTPKGSELLFWDVNYNMPWGANGGRVSFGDTWVRTHPQFVLALADIWGKSNNLYLSFSYPWSMSKIHSLQLTAGLNVLDSRTDQFGDTLYADHLRSLDIGFSTSFYDRLNGNNQIAANFRNGFPAFGYSSDTNQLTATTSRPGGHAAYTKLSGQFSRIQTFWGPLSIFSLIKGQWVSVPLLSSEQYTFGGMSLGRGYDPAELIGDRGASGSVELRYDLEFSHIIRSLQTYSFYDIGSVWNILVNNTSPDKVSAASAGVGMRFAFSRNVNGNLTWAQPLTKQVSTEELIGRGARPRVFFSVVVQDA